ncbi:hypothetical protein BU16DRAFT_560424 [Lophium mytilinum]|uniref:FAR1 domain-containing protein n=1 Tax=Lophium mytilinum TaxID=390894 RepID=A0A6A6QY13_9PEZI|nr:hypothetical protein BU16DRAFT_560424 [Lophium mytilinum]
MALQPPPPQSYNTLEEAEEALRVHASAHGYGLTKSRSKKDKKSREVKKVWFRCCFGGTSESNARVRNTSTMKAGCKMNGTLTRQPPGLNGERAWLWATVEEAHNSHPPMLKATAAACNRKRSASTNRLIRMDAASGARPNETYMKLLEKGVTIIVQDIVNERARYRSELRGGLTPIVPPPGPLTPAGTGIDLFLINLAPFGPIAAPTPTPAAAFIQPPTGALRSVVGRLVQRTRTRGRKQHRVMQFSGRKALIRSLSLSLSLRQRQPGLAMRSSYEGAAAMKCIRMHDKMQRLYSLTYGYAYGTDARENRAPVEAQSHSGQLED